MPAFAKLRREDQKFGGKPGLYSECQANQPVLHSEILPHPPTHTKVFYTRLTVHINHRHHREHEKEIVETHALHV